MLFEKLKTIVQMWVEVAEIWVEFLGRGENEAILNPRRHEKRSLAELNEHFRNEIWVKMGRLQPDPKKLNQI